MAEMIVQLKPLLVRIIYLTLEQWNNCLETSIWQENTLSPFQVHFKTCAFEAYQQMKVHHHLPQHHKPSFHLYKILQRWCNHCRSHCQSLGSPGSQCRSSSLGRKWASGNLWLHGKYLDNLCRYQRVPIVPMVHQCIHLKVEFVLRSLDLQDESFNMNPTLSSTHDISVSLNL